MAMSVTFGKAIGMAEVASVPGTCVSCTLALAIVRPFLDALLRSLAPALPFGSCLFISRLLLLVRLDLDQKRQMLGAITSSMLEHLVVEALDALCGRDLVILEV